MKKYAMALADKCGVTTGQILFDTRILVHVVLVRKVCPSTG